MTKPNKSKEYEAEILAIEEREAQEVYSIERIEEYLL